MSVSFGLTWMETAWVVAVSVLATTVIWRRIPRWTRHRPEIELPTAALISTENVYGCVPWTSFGSTMPEFTTPVPSYGHGSAAEPQSSCDGKRTAGLPLAPAAPSSGSGRMNEYGLPKPAAFAATHVSASVFAGSKVAVWNPSNVKVTMSP